MTNAMTASLKSDIIITYPNKSHNMELKQLTNIKPKIVLIVPYLINELKAILWCRI
jgi:hypothetical protein